LVQIRDIKMTVVAELKKHQQDYISGVERLNKERLSLSRQQIDALESAVDYSKSNWYRCLKKAQEIESQEKAQLAQLIIAERNLKSVEKLIVKHHDAARLEAHKQDIKLMDE